MSEIVSIIFFSASSDDEEAWAAFDASEDGSEGEEGDEGEGGGDGGADTNGSLDDFWDVVEPPHDSRFHLVTMFMRMDASQRRIYRLFCVDSDTAALATEELSAGAVAEDLTSGDIAIYRFIKAANGLKIYQHVLTKLFFLFSNGVQIGEGYSTEEEAAFVAFNLPSSGPATGPR